MEELNTNPSGGTNNQGISNVQKWILATFGVVLSISLILGYSGSEFFIYTLWYFLIPTIGIYYTIILYRKSYANSKYNWIPLVIEIACIFFQSLINCFNVDLPGSPSFPAITALCYILSVVFLYKWETIGKAETRWIPLTISILVLVGIDIFYLVTVDKFLI